MMVLLDTSEKQMSEAIDEIGDGVEIGVLHTPASNRAHRGNLFGADCGAFKFLPHEYRNLLKKLLPFQQDCIFAVVPDVVASAIRTRELFNHWSPDMRGWPLAYVTQDGQDRVDIPWSEIKAIFIGGTDEHKDGPEGEACIRAAIGFEKHVHVGRVNGMNRVGKLIQKFGWYPRLSIDGSAISTKSRMRIDLGKAIRRPPHPELFATEEAA
jgi:hypothetical protein